MSHRPIRCLMALLVSVPLLAMVQPGSMVLSILGISFLIFVHEWGHFTACRLTGTRTETFSIGFGPRLFGWEKDREGKRRFTIGRRQLDAADHAMDFRIAAIPLGGYVKMAGEIPAQGGAGDANEPAPDEFPAKSAWARTFIISAGVIMNFITAVVFYTIAVQAGKSFTPPVVGEVLPGGAAWSAGLQTGDRVERINGNDTPTWLDLQMEIAFASGKDAASVVVDRAGKTLPSIAVKPTTNEERGILQLGIGRAIGFTVGEGDAAVEIGPEEDGIVGGLPVHGGAEARAAWHDAVAVGMLPIRVQNAKGESFEFAPTPATAGKDPNGEVSPKIGVSPYIRPTVKALRGDAHKVLKKGDVLVAAVSDGARTPIVSPWQIVALRFRPAIDALIIEREGKELTVDVGLSSPAAVAAFTNQVVFDGKTDTRIVPLPASHLYLLKDIYRAPRSPALDAGIPVGARLTKIGSVITREWPDIIKALEGIKADEPLLLTYETLEGKEETREIRPVALEYLGKSPSGALPYMDHWKTDGIGGSIAMGFGRTIRETTNVFRTIGSLFAGTINFNKNIAGPITLIDASSKFAERDPLQLIWFLAYVSVMLAVLNILPIPVLDGGHLMFILIEKIKGAPLKDETIYRFQQVGFLMLLVLMGFAFKNDFVRIFS